MTEEGIRHALSDLKMPKNVISSIVAQAERTKQEVSTMVAKEVRHFLDGIKVDDILKKALMGQTIEVSATIRFVDNKRKKKRPKAV